MKTKGKLKGLSRDMDGGLVVSFRVYEEKKVISHLSEIKDMDTIQITAEPVKKKRSLTANAYYWVLIGKVADKLDMSTSRAHNLILRRYGAIETVDGDEMICFVPDTENAENEALEADKYHIKPTSATKVYKDGGVRRMYKILKPSHEYDSKEMSTLIHGLVDECNHLGIETATPDEVEEMLARYAKYHSKV